MKAFKLIDCNSGPAPKQWEDIPEIKQAKEAIPTGKYEEISLQILQGLPDGVHIVKWYGTSKGFWHPVSEFFLVTLK